MQKLLDPVSGLLQTVITVKSLHSSVWEPFTTRGPPLRNRKVAKRQAGGRSGVDIIVLTH